MEKLTSYAYDKYSQSGEDGIIEKIFEAIPASYKQRMSIEFGAWDGFYLSNTANLWTNGWKGILIEADENKFIDLVQNVADYDCVCINEFVSYPPENTLEVILERHKVDYSEIDFLSIDIDGDDWYVFESLDKLKPKVISCEFNVLLPAFSSYVQKRGATLDRPTHGCSAFALTDLAMKKGYTLVSILSCNCIYVKNDYRGYFSNYLTGIELIKDFIPYQRKRQRINKSMIWQKLYNIHYVYQKYGVRGVIKKVINKSSIVE